MLLASSPIACICDRTGLARSCNFFTKRFPFLALVDFAEATDVSSETSSSASFDSPFSSFWVRSFTWEVSFALDRRFKSAHLSANTSFNTWYHFGSVEAARPLPSFIRFVILLCSSFKFEYLVLRWKCQGGHTFACKPMPLFVCRIPP